MITPPARRRTEGGLAKRRGKRPTRPVDWLHLGALLLLLLAVPAAFQPALSADWVNWDDQRNFLENPCFRGLEREHLDWMWTTFHMGHYQPLSWMSLGYDYTRWEMDAKGYHRTNVALHALAALLFYQFLRVLLRRVLPGAAGAARTLGALAGALLFALHPLRVESVAWITERRDVLSLALLLPGLLAWLGAVDPQGSRDKRRLLYATALLFHALSLLAKAHAITLPFLLLLMDTYPLKRLRIGEPGAAGRVPALLLEKAPFFLLAAGAAVLAILAQRHAGALRPLEEHGLPARLAVAAQSVAFYLGKTLLPTGLSPLYLLEETVDPRQARFLLAAGVLAALGLGLSLARRRFPAGLATFTSYLILVAPVCGLSQAGPQAMADRYTYFATLPLAALAGAGCAVLFARCRPSPVLLAPLLFLMSLLGVATFRQTTHWRDGESLWRRALAVNPESFMANYNLGEALAQMHRFAEAIPCYRRSLELKPGQGRVLAGIALAHFFLGERPQALQALEAISRDADPGWYTQARSLCGQTLASLGRPAEALPLLEEALAAEPEHEAALRTMAAVLRALGRIEESYRLFERLHRLDAQR